MKNKIEDIVFTKDKSQRAKKEQVIKNLIQDPAEKEKIVKEFQEALDNSGKRIEFIRQQIDLKLKLQEVSEIISLSYIAKNYFNKTRQWLYQRINGNVVDGKKREFTNEQIKTLNFALKDISKKIGSLSV